MSENLNRTLILLEHLSAAKRTGITVAQLIEQTGLASSTVYRLVQELEALGYLRKSDDRRLFPKFHFEQGMSFGGVDVGLLVEACRDVCTELVAAAEFIALRRETLFWHVAEGHPPLQDVEANWDIAGFYEVGVSGRKVPWDEARAQISAVDTADMQFDLMGNAKGVRRFCVAVHGDEGEFVGLLTAAEAATPLRDVESHVARVRSVLLAARAAVENGTKTMMPKLTHQA